MTTSYPVIRPARRHEYDEVARVWMESWVSTGLDTASEALLTKLRDRVYQEIENGWSLFVADDGGRLAAMLAISLPKMYLDMLFVAPESGTFGRPAATCLYANTFARRNLVALRARKRKGLALV